MKKQTYVLWFSIDFCPIGKPILLGACNVLMMLMISAGCSSHDSRLKASVRTNSATLEVVSALTFMKELHEQNGLVGLSKDEHGLLDSDDVPLASSNENVYPMVLTLHAVKTGESATNHYTVVRQSKDAPWQIQRAWRTDSQGNLVEEWPVK